MSAWHKRQGPAPLHSQHRKTRKLQTTDTPLIAAELERQSAATSA
jgi:hypothetical protein